MPRKPAVAPPSRLPAVHEDALRQDAEIAAKLATIEAGYTPERDLVNQLFGRAQAAHAIAKLTTVWTLATLSQIKETKAYRALSGTKGMTPGGEEIADVGTWDGFLCALGMSRTTVDEDLTNLHTFGAEALESLQAAGAGVRELRRLRRLPQDDRRRLAHAADVDELRELLEEAEGHRAKLETLVTDQQAELQARDRVIEKKARKLDELARELSVRRHGDRHEAAAAIWRGAYAVDARLTGIDADIEQLVELSADEGLLSPSRLAAAQALVWIVRQCMALAARHGLQWDLEQEITPPGPNARPRRTTTPDDGHADPS